MLNLLAPEYMRSVFSSTTEIGYWSEDFANYLNQALIEAYGDYQLYLFICFWPKEVSKANNPCMNHGKAISTHALNFQISSGQTAKE